MGLRLPYKYWSILGRTLSRWLCSTKTHSSVTFLVGTEVLARLALALLPCFNQIISLSVKTQRIAGIHYKIKGSSLRRMPVLVWRQTKGGRRQCNLVPRAFPLKNGWPHPFFKGKALGTSEGSGIARKLGGRVKKAKKVSASVSATPPRRRVS